MKRKNDHTHGVHINRLRSGLTMGLITTGLISFWVSAAEGLPFPALLLLILVSLVFPVLVVVDVRMQSAWTGLMLPFAAGLLLWPMRTFYWDRFDFSGRVVLLLLLALFFSLYRVFKEFAWAQKLLSIFNGLSVKRRLVVIFLACWALFILAAGVIVEKGVELGGDEPHYLALSQSIIKDGDLNVFNQYFRGGYKDFIQVEKLPAHGAFGKGYKKMYSIHLPGVAFTVAPFLLLDVPLPVLYFIIRAFLGIFGALLAVLIYLFSLRLWQRENVSLFITTVFMLCTPVFFHSLHVFPELQALLLLLSSLYLLFFPGPMKQRMTMWAGLLLGMLVFWGLKYLIFTYLFAGGFFFYFFVVKKERVRAFLLLLFPLLLQGLFFTYLYFAYGNFSPMSVYTGMMSAGQAKAYYGQAAAIPLQQRIETLLNYFFDQRDGLLLVAPFFFFAFPGLVTALRKWRKYWQYVLVAVPAFIYILYHGYSTVRPGYCPQARYLVPVLWVLLLFAVVYVLEYAGKGGNQRGVEESLFLWKGIRGKIFFLLLLYSLGVVVYQVLHPFTLYQPTTHDSLLRPGLMFQQWSNMYIYLPGFLPSFIKVEGNFHYLPNLVFLVLFLVLVVWAACDPLWVGRKLRFANRLGNRAEKGRGGLGLAVCFGVLFVFLCLFPRVPYYNGILVEKEGAVPFTVYGESRRPAKAVEYEFKIEKGQSGYGAYSITLATLEPVARFAALVRLTDSRAGLGELGTIPLPGTGLDRAQGHKPVVVPVTFVNFDEKAAEVQLQSGKIENVLIDRPRYKRFKNKFFYRFTILYRVPGEFGAGLAIEMVPTSG